MGLQEKLESAMDKNPFMPLSKAVYVVMKDEIMENRIGTDAKLVVTAYADTFGVSRSPIKSAFDKLTSEGLLEQRRSSYYVKRLSKDNYMNYYLLRVELEAMAIRQTARLITDEELTKLGLYLGALNGAYEKEDFKKIIDSDIVFHRYIIECSQNPYFISGFDRVIPDIRRYMVYDLSDKSLYPILMSNNEMIYKSLEMHSPDVSEAVVREHLRQNQLTYEDRFPRIIGSTRRKSDA